MSVPDGENHELKDFGSDTPSKIISNPCLAYSTPHYMNQDTSMFDALQNILVRGIKQMASTNLEGQEVLHKSMLATRNITVVLFFLLCASMALNLYFLVENKSYRL